jgi:signal transduction histidine kinase
MKARQTEAKVNLSPHPCVISADPVLLQQVLVSLVINAMDAMAETPPARRHLTIRTEVRAAEVELSVSDTGTGLPAHIDGKLFTPFVTTKAHGLGIGLTIARTIVDAHGGTIDAHNNPEGARHSLSPCAAAKRPRSCQTRRVPHDIPRKTHWARNEQARRGVLVLCVNGLPDVLDNEPRSLGSATT